MKNFVQGFLSGVLLMLALLFLLPATVLQDVLPVVEKKVIVEREVAAVKQPSLEIEKPQLPLDLPAPKFHKSSPKLLKTNKNAEVFIRWDNIENAERTRIVVFDQNGQAVKTTSTKGNYIYLQNIPWKGTIKDEYLDYTVRLASGTSENEYFELSEPRKLRVYRDHLGIYNSLVAPEIKSITTED